MRYSVPFLALVLATSACEPVAAQSEEYTLRRTEVIERLIVPLCMELGWTKQAAMLGCFEVNNTSACTVYVNWDLDVAVRDDVFAIYRASCLQAMRPDAPYAVGEPA